MNTSREEHWTSVGLEQRLWTLFRTRHWLDADTAASVLVDAGDDVAIKRTAENAGRYFRKWVRGGYAAESAVRPGTGNRFKRYALIKDCGPLPPGRDRAMAAAGDIA